jgi:hypothetical protein
LLSAAIVRLFRENPAGPSLQFIRTVSSHRTPRLSHSIHGAKTLWQ